MTKVLASLGRALGDPSWVQGPGGNVSVKTDNGELLVKASGRRLLDVGNEGGYASVSLELARRALGGDEIADKELFARTPRPSLETYFHTLGGRVVAHVHAVGALLYACSNLPVKRRIDEGLWSVPYVRPGRGLALAVRKVLGDARRGVVVLRSHGVIAFADDEHEVIELLQRFDERAREPFGRLPPFPEVVATYTSSPYQPAGEGVVYRVLPPRTLREADPPRYLFPDAPVCASIVLVDRDPQATAVMVEALSMVGRACVLQGPGGTRVAVAKNSEQLEAACEVVAAHDWVEDALCMRGLVQYLPDDEPAGILSMPSEAYRIRLAGASKC